MKISMKKIAAALCAVAAAIPLGGWGPLSSMLAGAFGASGYVQGILDSTYKGVYDKYMETTDATEEEAEEGFEAGLEVEANYLAQYLSFGDYFASDEMDPDLKQEMVDYYRELYSHSQYEVGEAIKTDSGYNVEVKVQPINILNDAMDDLTAYLDDFTARADNGEFDAMTDAEFYKTYGEGAMEILNSWMDRFTYGEETAIVVLVYQDEDGLYTISDNDFTNLDTNMVIYP